MTSKKWEKVADKEFYALDKDWQEEWRGLRELTKRHK